MAATPCHAIWALLLYACLANDLIAVALFGAVRALPSLRVHDDDSLAHVPE